MSTEGRERETAKPDDRVEIPRGGHVPLNSKRLTAAYLRRLAGALEIPTSASSEELRQLIAGKLEEMEREPMNVQVGLRKTDRGVHLTLRDVDGIILEVDPSPPEAGTEREHATSEEEEEESNPPTEEGVDSLREALRQAKEESEAYQSKVNQLQEELVKEKARVKEFWRMNCVQLAEFDATLEEKDEEIAQLRRQLDGLPPPCVDHVPEDAEMELERVAVVARPRRGRAPPVDPFTGENPEVRLEDWLPSLQRAAKWNEWSGEEEMIQLAGHLRGRALQEWNLLGEEDLQDLDTALSALRERLSPGSKVLAGQDFRHTVQGESESVADYIRRLERMFQVAYGRDGMRQDTRETILYGQMQEGLRLELMQSPSVSGALMYKELCVAAKTEERRQSELRKRQDYFKHTLNPAPSKRSSARADQPAKTPSRGDQTVSGNHTTQQVKPPMRETRVGYR